METKYFLTTFQQEHQVEDPVQDDICSNMHSIHLYQEPAMSKWQKSIFISKRKKTTFISEEPENMLQNKMIYVSA